MSTPPTWMYRRPAWTEQHHTDALAALTALWPEYPSQALSHIQRKAARIQVVQTFWRLFNPEYPRERANTCNECALSAARNLDAWIQQGPPNIT